MRHVLGFILAFILAAVLFAGGGWAISRIGAIQLNGAALASVPGLLGMAAVLGTGLLLGTLLVAPGVSPLAAGLPGLALLAWSALLVVSSRRAIRLIPLHGYAIAAGFQTMLSSGVLALLGIVMVIPLFVPSRWRRRTGRGDDFAPRTSTSLLR